MSGHSLMLVNIFVLTTTLAISMRCSEKFEHENMAKANLGAKMWELELGLISPIHNDRTVLIRILPGQGLVAVVSESSFVNQFEMVSRLALQIGERSVVTRPGGLASKTLTQSTHSKVDVWSHTNVPTPVLPSSAEVLILHRW
jgi:hypothetical protein